MCLRQYATTAPRLITSWLLHTLEFYTDCNKYCFILCGIISFTSARLFHNNSGSSFFFFMCPCKVDSMLFSSYLELFDASGNRIKFYLQPGLRIARVTNQIPGMAGIHQD